MQTSALQSYRRRGRPEAPQYHMHSYTSDLLVKVDLKTYQPITVQYSSIDWNSLAFSLNLFIITKTKLEKVQRSATRIVLPHCSYEERLEILELPSLYDFIACLSKTHFIEILHNPSHPLFKRLVFNNSRTPICRPNTFRTAKAKAVAYTNSFF